MVYFVLNDYRIETIQFFNNLFPCDILIFDFDPLKPLHFPKHPRHRQTRLFIHLRGCRMFQNLRIDDNILPNNFPLPIPFLLSAFSFRL